jgi:CRP-like cAMP-binding protein
MSFPNVLEDKLSFLSKEARSLIYGIEEEKTWPKEAYLFREGEVCRHIYLVESGIIRATQLKDGKEINLYFRFEGEFVTNLKSLRAGCPSEYSLQAIEPAETVGFSKDALFHAYQASSEIESWGKQVVEQMLIAQEEHSTFFKLYSPEERYAYLLVHQPSLIQRVSLSHLASYIGITRESLSRIRKRLQG